MDMVEVGITIPVTCSQQRRVQTADTDLRSCAVHRTANPAVHLSEPLHSRGRLRWSDVTEQY